MFELLAIREGGERTNLVRHGVRDLVGRQRHVTASESGKVWVSGMRSDAHPVLFGESDRPRHPIWVSCMKTASDIGRGDVLDDVFVHAHLVRRVRFADIGI